jgi:hypothetical protein
MAEINTVTTTTVRMEQQEKGVNTVKTEEEQPEK